VLNIAETKRIAQAIIHFEPVWEALALHGGDDMELKRDARISPAEAKRRQHNNILYLEKSCTLKDMRALTSQLNNILWSWAFELGDQLRPRLKFCKSPAGDPADLLFWVDLALTFVEAGLSCSLAAGLRSYPATHEGLRRFISQRGLGTERLCGARTVLTTPFLNSIPPRIAEAEARAVAAGQSSSRGR
jgi:hypothetical protein